MQKPLAALLASGLLSALALAHEFAVRRAVLVPLRVLREPVRRCRFRADHESARFFDYHRS